MTPTCAATLADERLRYLQAVVLARLAAGEEWSLLLTLAGDMAREGRLIRELISDHMRNQHGTQVYYSASDRARLREEVLA